MYLTKKPFILAVFMMLSNKRRFLMFFFEKTKQYVIILRFYLGGSMKTLLFIILTVLFFGCSGSKHEETLELKISYSLGEGVTCQTYLADHFLITVYDSKQRKYTEKTISCDSDEPDSLTLYVKKGFYYISVVLRSSDDLWQSYGATKADVSDDAEVMIDMSRYLGGMIFKWDSSDCDKYNISEMAFDIFSEEGTVSAIVWGESVMMSDFRVPCSGERLEVINIPPEPLYSAKVNAFRTSASKQSRVLYEIPDFFSGNGQNKTVGLGSYKKILVSDMKVAWEFDSKSLDSCEDAGVTQAVAVLDSDKYTITATRDCENKFPNVLNIYDITENEYTLTLYGKNSSGEALFEASLDLGLIEPGSVGKDALKPDTILLKEK